MTMKGRIHQIHRRTSAASPCVRPSGPMFRSRTVNRSPLLVVPGATLPAIFDILIIEYKALNEATKEREV